MKNDPFLPLTAGVLTGEIDNDLRLIRSGSHAEQSEDVILHDFLLLGHRAALLYIDGLSDDEKLQRFVLAPCLNMGTKIGTRLCLLYVDGVAKKENVAEMKQRILGCNVDYVSSMGMPEQLIEDQPLSLLPQTVTTGRPDRAVSFLEEGQTVLLMENVPAALAMPVGLLHLYHAPDDTALRLCRALFPADLGAAHRGADQPEPPLWGFPRSRNGRRSIGGGSIGPLK